MTSHTVRELRDIVSPRLSLAIQDFGAHRILNNIGDRLHAFSEKTISLMYRCLHDGTVDPNGPMPGNISELSILSETEWDELMHEFNDLMLDMDFLWGKISLAEYERKKVKR